MKDHREIGRDLDLFMFSDYSPGCPIWLPAGPKATRRDARRSRRRYAIDLPFANRRLVPPATRTRGKDDSSGSLEWSGLAALVRPAERSGIVEYCQSKGVTMAAE